MTVMTMGAPAEQAQSRYGGEGRSPIGIGGAIAVHGLVLAIFLLLPKEVLTTYVPQTLIGKNIPADPPPPEKTETPPKAKQAVPIPAGPQPTAPNREVILPPVGGEVLTGGGDMMSGGGDGGTGIVQPPLETTPDPVLVAASIDPRARRSFQPEYPGAMIRQGAGGWVKVRVTIGPDGRVAGIEKLSATDEAFWTATQRHALRAWRFRPATRDGVPVESSQVLTVRFRLDSL